MKQWRSEDTNYKHVHMNMYSYERASFGPLIALFSLPLFVKVVIRGSPVHLPQKQITPYQISCTRPQSGTSLYPLPPWKGRSYSSTLFSQPTQASQVNMPVFVKQFLPGPLKDIPISLRTDARFFSPATGSRYQTDLSDSRDDTGYRDLSGPDTRM